MKPNEQEQFFIKSLNFYFCISSPDSEESVGGVSIVHWSIFKQLSRLAFGDAKILLPG